VRWHLFGYDTYYPGGGMNDYLGAFPSKKEALKASRRHSHNWFEIVYVEDNFTLTVVEGW
jgi:hypothetical protein